MVVLGIDTETNQPVELTAQARQQGVYVIGTTGTGKTTLLKNIIYQDIVDPKKPAVIVLDPHGDLTNELLELVPEGRKEDVILFAPGDPDFIARPLGLNLLDCDRTSPLERRLVASTVVDTLKKLFALSWGPRMEDLLRHSILSLMSTPDTSLLDLLLILASYHHRQEYKKPLVDPVLRHYWEQQFPESRPDKNGIPKTSREQVELVGSSLNKIGRFLVDPVIRHVVSQKTSAFNVREVMDNGQILLINLSKGRLGEDNSSLLGAVIINLILIAALSRGDRPTEERHRVHLIVDEYQSFATSSFPTLQSEARKYAIDLVVAHQYRDQLDDLNRGSTLNVANFVVMRVSGIDSRELAEQFNNTPEEPRLRPEPVLVEEMKDQQGEPLYIQRQLASGKGILYQLVEELRRMYTDVAAEMANTLSYLENHEGMCRILNAKGQLRKFRFRSVRVKDLYANVRPNRQVAQDIRRNSLKRGMELSNLEKVIEKKMGKIEFFEVAHGEFPFIEPGQ